METGKDITIQWSISKAVGCNIKYIWAFSQSQSRKHKVIWVDREPVVFRDGKNLWGLIKNRFH